MSGDGVTDQVILATGGYDHVIRFWQAHSGLSHKTVQHPECQVNRMEITPDKQLLAAAGYQHIRMYELNSNNPNAIMNFEGVQKNVTAVGFQEDGLWMYTGGEDGSVRIWDIRGGARSLQCQRFVQLNAPVNCVCLHPNQVEFIIGDQNGNIYRWDARTENAEIMHTCKDSSIQDIAIDGEATCMAAVTNKGMCLIWSLNGGLGEGKVAYKFKKDFQAHKRYALRCKFSPDSTLLITASADTTAKIWKTADDFSLMTTLQDPGVQRWVWDVAFSADSQYVITASSDNAARLWNAETGEVRRVYSGHQRVVTCLAFRDRPT